MLTFSHPVNKLEVWFKRFYYASIFNAWQDVASRHSIFLVLCTFSIYKLIDYGQIIVFCQLQKQLPATKVSSEFLKKKKNQVLSTLRSRVADAEPVINQEFVCVCVCCVLCVPFLPRSQTALSSRSGPRYTRTVQDP